MFNLDHLIQLFEHYKYLLIFPFAVFEGPIITIISGFLSSLHQLNFWISFGVVALGDLVGDSIYYSLGRYGREKFIRIFRKIFRLTPDRIEKIEQHFANHPWKTFTFGKIVHGTGSPILIAAGLAKVPYGEFLGYNIPTTLANSFIIITIGYFFGSAYHKFDTYFGYFAMGGLVAVALLYWYFIKQTKKSYEADENTNRNG